ncbi:hypothetical protein FRC07_006612 [Ceratobasidium sp. 392]|nr:hypothetical protein FRC07_006612 [Ceratobasidium sp. 392]
MLRPTSRLLNAFNAARSARRPYHTLGFIGLGQMGLNMADNLFTRTATAYAEGSTAESSKPPVFLVFDVNTITADTFARDVANRFPGVLVEVAGSPADLAREDLDQSSKSNRTTQICNNLVLGIQQIAVAEAMLLGTSLGLSPAMLAGVLNTSTGRCWSSEVNNPIPGALPGKSPPCEKDYHGGFASKLMQKDMVLAQHAASTVSAPLPLGDAATNIYATMNGQDNSEGQKFADKDFSVVYEYLRQLASKQQV